MSQFSHSGLPMDKFICSTAAVIIRRHFRCIQRFLQNWHKSSCQVTACQYDCLT